MYSVLCVRDAAGKTALSADHVRPSVLPSVCLSVCRIYTKQDMVRYKKLSSNCKFHECRLCGNQTSLKGVSEPNLYFPHISTDLGEIPYRMFPFKGDE
jgi:hypothetical protein